MRHKMIDFITTHLKKATLGEVEERRLTFLAADGETRVFCVRAGRKVFEVCVRDVTKFKDELR